MLRTRGLLVLRLPSPPPPTEGWFKWLLAPSSECNEMHTWYLDGSLQDGCWTEYRAAGFGIVVVAPDASLAAYGMGVPPSWCNTAAAAETWALHTALTQSPFPPQLRTDCQSLLTIAREGTAQATGASRPLARIWKLIATSLDGCIESVIESGALVWMPAHQALSAIGEKSLSNGKLLTGVDWRANRLVDALAKLAAATVRAPREVRCLLESGKAAVKHAAAMLAVVTHRANNHMVPVQRPDGTWGTRVARDAQQPARHSRKVRRPPKPPTEPATLADTTGLVLGRAGEWGLERPSKRPRTASAKVQARRKAADLAQTRRRVEEVGAAAGVAETGMSAQQRLDAVSRRVRARFSSAA
jgi:hypothetical protein